MDQTNIIEFKAYRRYNASEYISVYIGVFVILTIWSILLSVFFSYGNDKAFFDAFKYFILIDLFGPLVLIGYDILVKYNQLIELKIDINHRIIKLKWRGSLFIDRNRELNYADLKIIINIGKDSFPNGIIFSKKSGGQLCNVAKEKALFSNPDFEQMVTVLKDLAIFDIQIQVNSR